MSSGAIFILDNNQGPEDRLLDGDTFTVGNVITPTPPALSSWLLVLLIVVLVVVAIMIVNRLPIDRDDARYRRQ